MDTAGTNGQPASLTRLFLRLIFLKEENILIIVNIDHLRGVMARCRAPWLVFNAKRTVFGRRFVFSGRFEKRERCLFDSARISSARRWQSFRFRV